MLVLMLFSAVSNCALTHASVTFAVGSSKTLSIKAPHCLRAEDEPLNAGVENAERNAAVEYKQFLALNNSKDLAGLPSVGEEIY